MWHIKLIAIRNYGDATEPQELLDEACGHFTWTDADLRRFSTAKEAAESLKITKDDSDLVFFVTLSEEED